MIQWICDFKSPSGYGRASRAEVRCLIKAGIVPNVVIHQHDRTQLILTDHKFWGEWAPRVLETNVEMPSVAVWHETPEFYRSDPMRADVARFAWETSRVLDYDHGGDPSHNWAEQLNTMTEVWVPSEFVAKALRDSGVTTRCEVIPHPLDLEEYKPGPKVTLPGGTNDDRFTALSVFQNIARKNAEALLTAWSCSSLGKRRDCCLLLKTYGASSDPFANQTLIREISGFRQRLNIRNIEHNVYPITRIMHEREMPELYRSADVHICVSRGEGFGLPCSESSACGLPQIYADHTALKEFCVGYPVACHEEPVVGMSNIPWYSAEQTWWSVDIKILMETLEKAYADWRAGKLAEHGKQARARVASLHSDERCGALFKSRLEALQQWTD